MITRRWKCSGDSVLKVQYDDPVGIASGVTGNSAILVYSSKMAPTERSDIYVMIFPPSPRVSGSDACSSMPG